MGCCIAKADNKTPLQKDQDRFSAIQAPDQPMRQITYLDAEGSERHYWATSNPRPQHHEAAKRDQIDVYNVPSTGAIALT
jgi:hypothetical protein